MASRIKELEEEIRRKNSAVKLSKISCQRIECQQENVVVNCLQRIDVSHLAQAPLDTELKPLELHTGKYSECQACRNASWLDEKKIEADEFF